MHLRGTDSKLDVRNRQDQGWCKYCATLEKDLTYSLEIKEKWADENSWEDVSFKPLDQYFESKTSTSLPDQQDSRKRKYGPVCADRTCISSSSHL